MNFIEKSPCSIGSIEFFVFNEFRQIIKSYSFKNTVQYEGFDALGLIMSGQLNAHVNAMYFRWENTGSGVLQDVSGRDVTAADFRALSGNRDFIRVQLMPGAVSGTTLYPQYSSNQATFAGIAALGDLGAAQGLAFNAGGEVEMCALAIAPEWSDSSQDMVYAAWAPTSLITIPAAGGVGLRWTILFAHQWT